MLKRLAIFACVGGLLGAASVAAQTAPSAPPTTTSRRLPTGTPINVPAGRWVVDYGNVRCSLARRIGGAGSPILILSSFLGRDEPEFILIGDTAPLPILPATVRVTLGPSGQAAEGRVLTQRRAGGRTRTIQALGEGFIDRFAAASHLRVASRDQTFIDMALPEAAAAVAALKACNDDLLQSWGVDPAVVRSLSREARLVDGSISDGDYPRTAVWRGERGPVVARFNVNAQGLVESCAVAVSSGSVLLDNTTCQLISRRFRYEPALDANGRPTVQPKVQTVHWLLPD